MTALLQRLIDASRHAGGDGVRVSGSFARGDAHGLQRDVDLIRYLRGETADGYFVRYVDGKLVSVTTVTIAQKRAEMQKPGSAMCGWFRRCGMRILLDKDGALAKLQLDAELFEWDRAEAGARQRLSGGMRGRSAQTDARAGARRREAIGTPR